MQCPNCPDGYNPPLFSIMPGQTYKDFPCQICGGSGELPEDIEYDLHRGRVLRARRLFTQMTLRNFCIAQGIDPVERSRNERGYFRKEK